jgi:Xaa-Pro aminopeptidase
MDQPLYPDFPKEEFDLRYRRARRMMEDAGIDALLVTEEKNYIYFTGHRSQQNPIDKIRPYVFLLPREGEPVVFVMPFEEGHVRLTTWIKDVRPYNLFRHNEVIVETLQELRLGGGRIGCELGREQYLEISHNDFQDLQARLPKAAFVDGAQILLSLRAIKSSAEIERCRTAAVTAARALDRVFEHVRPGMTNLEVAHLARRLLVDAGAEHVPFMALASGYDFTKGKITVPTPRRLEEGDTLTVDTAAEMRGYTSDIARTVVVGRASQKQRDMYAFVIDLNFKCYGAIREGNRCEDVVRTAQVEIARRGLKTQAVGRIGHGVGCEATEYPSLALGEHVVMEPGMTLACNPNFVTDYGFFNSEENLVVTNQGYEFLSDPIAPNELRVVG